MRRIGKIHARKAFRSDRDGANRDIIGASLQPRQQVAHLRDGHQLVPLVQMLGDTAPQVDAGTDERPAATLPAVRRDLIDADTQRALEARFRSYGRVSKYKDKQRAETGARHAKAMHRFATIGAPAEFHMTRLAWQLCCTLRAALRAVRARTKPSRLRVSRESDGAGSASRPE
jgi:hypothetical protein